MSPTLDVLPSIADEPYSRALDDFELIDFSFTVGVPVSSSIPQGWSNYRFIGFKSLYGGGTDFMVLM